MKRCIDILLRQDKDSLLPYFLVKEDVSIELMDKYEKLLGRIAKKKRKKKDISTEKISFNSTMTDILIPDTVKSLDDFLFCEVPDVTEEEEFDVATVLLRYSAYFDAKDSLQ